MYRASAREAALERENRALRARLARARLAVRKGTISALASALVGPMIFLWGAALVAVLLGGCLGVASRLDSILGLQ